MMAGKSTTRAEREIRRAKVLDLVMNSNMTNIEISKQLKVSKMTITNDRKALGIANPRFHTKHATVASLAARRKKQHERRKKIAEIMRTSPQEVSNGYLARYFGVHLDTIRKDLQTLGISSSFYRKVECRKSGNYGIDLEDTEEL